MSQTSSTLTELFPFILIVLVIALGTLQMRRRGYVASRGAHVIVRCREGHLFTTIWVPFMSFKSIRLGMVRFQRCPVDNHLTFVTPVNETELTEEEKRIAAEHQDTNIP